MKKQISIITTIGVFAGILFGTTLYHSAYSKKNNSINSGSPQLQYVTDFEDINKVVGAAENVFVGKVVKNVGKYEPKKNETQFPRTLFRVEPLYNIKGIIKEEILARQMGGYDSYDRLLVPDDGGLLKEGEIYMFSGGKGDGFYWIDVHPNSYINLHIEGEDFRSEISKNKTVQKFREAYVNEIYSDIDRDGEYKFSSEINAYKNLSKEEKEKLKDIENGFVEK